MSHFSQVVKLHAPTAVRESRLQTGLNGIKNSSSSLAKIDNNNDDVHFLVGPRSIIARHDNSISRCLVYFRSRVNIYCKLSTCLCKMATFVRKEFTNGSRWRRCQHWKSWTNVDKRIRVTKISIPICRPSQFSRSYFLFFFFFGTRTFINRIERIIRSRSTFISNQNHQL